MMNDLATTLVLAMMLSVVPAPPIPTLVRTGPNDWHVSFPPGAVTANYVWHVQTATNPAGPWADAEPWWSGDTFIVKQQPILFIRLAGATNSQLLNPNS